jgi:putative photosynthetic complex assembly protein 2
MDEPLIAALVVVGAWWLSTGAVLRLVWLDASTYPVSLAASTVLGLASLGGVIALREDTSVSAAYLGFACALGVWAWHELAFLLGVVTGPRKVAADLTATGWTRFRHAAATVMHHELALAATALALVALSVGAANQVAAWTFGILWAMRVSAKLNVFLGVRNVAREFVPSHLRYLVSYFRRARFNPLMPLSLLAGFAAAAAFAHRAFDAGTGYAAVRGGLLATLTLLAAIEHVFLAVSLPDAALWRWALRPKRVQDTNEPQTPVREAPSSRTKQEDSADFMRPKGDALRAPLAGDLPNDA